MFSIYFLEALIPVDYFFVPLLGEGLEWRGIPSSWWDRVSELSFDKVLYCGEWAFIIEKALGLFHNGYFPLFLCQSQEKILSYSHCEDLVEFLKENSQKCGGVP